MSVFLIVAATAAMLLFWPFDGPETAPAQVPNSTESGDVNRTTPPAVEVAERWLMAYRSVTYNDPSPTTWIERALPLSSGPVARALRDARGGSVGADWTTFVQRRCRTSVEQLHGVIPAEAPATEGTVYVQLSADVVTYCAKTTAVQDPPSEPVAATVEVLRGDDGTWRVNRRLY